MCSPKCRLIMTIAAVGFIAFFAAMIVPWGPPMPAGAAEHPNGGTLTFGVESEFAGFEVLASASRLAINGAIAANTIMEPMFRLDPDGNLLAVLGLSATESEDGKTWTVELRQGVRFHDGTAFNADAVVDHWQRLLDPANKYRGRAALAVLESVEKAGSHTVRFRLQHTWLPFLRVITSARSLTNLIPSPKAVADGTQNRAPVGTGPFMFKEWDAGDHFTVVKNPKYWKQNVPHLDAVVFKPLPDSQTRYAALKSGQLDLIWSDRGNLIHKAAQDPGLSVFRSDDNGAEIFLLNTAEPPLDDKTVRRALAHAHNQARHVALVYGDSIPMVHHPFGSDFECTGDGYREYDPARARQMLADRSRPLDIECLHSNSPRGRETGEITQQLMREIDVQITPVGLNFGPVVKKVLSGQYQISTWRMPSLPDQGPALFRAFHSESPGNHSHYQNPEMDRLLLAQRVETDPEKRRRLLCGIARRIVRLEDVWLNP